MATARVYPESPEERLIYWSIVGTWVFWLLGALYLLAPALGWTLVVVSTSRCLGFGRTFRYARIRLPFECIIWIVGVFVMLFALLAGHFNFDLGIGHTIKSVVGWMKGWALLAVFIFIGSTLRIRPIVIYRASNILAAQTLALAPLFVLAFIAHLPRTLYVSPIEIIGGPGPEFFRVSLYILGDASDAGGARFGFFAPWAPAAALVSNIAFVLALFDKDKRWAAVGVTSSIAVSFLAQSRMSLVAIPAVSLMIVLLSNLTRPYAFWMMSSILITAIPFLAQISSMIENFIIRFNSARAASSRVRATLQSIARHRWETEAPIWGHGIVERGSHLVEYMPIGSHHTWNGLLYVKGIIGVMALTAPLSFSILQAILKSQADRASRAALGVLLILVVYSFGENLEILTYLYWPGVLIVGIAMKRRYVSSFHTFLTGDLRPQNPTRTTAAVQHVVVTKV